MVSFTDLKFYGTVTDDGGEIDLTKPIQTATANNLYTKFIRSELISGATKYKCFYMKNESAEDMENFKIWISSGTPLDTTSIHFGFDTLANPFDGAVGFDGVNDYVDCTNDATLWSKTLTKFSFAVSIYPTAGGDGNERNVVSHGGSSNQSFRLIIDQSNNTRIKFTIKDSGGVNYTASAYNLVQNAWNHISCSYDNSLGSENIRIYVNGVQQDAQDFTGSINISAILSIADSSNDFKGYIKDFKFWDDQSINTAEALELYEENELANSTPAYHLQFGERTGTTSKDAVSKTKLATLSGAWWKVYAQGIANQFVEPDVRGSHWYQAQEIESKTFKLKSGLIIPIWVQVTGSDPLAQDYLDDNGIFTIRFDITSTGTGTPGVPNTGGNTGGNTPTTSDYKIAFAGDWGNTGDTSDVISMMKSQDYDLIVGVGDNAYDDSSASSWCSKFDSLKDKMESAMGNHEYDDGPLSTYKSFFGMSSTHKAVRFENCLILIIDSNDGEDSDAPSLDSERTWAKNELEKYKNDTKVVWRIAVMHHPWFGEGAKHAENEFGQVEKFHKMFTDYDVNFVYTGHNHHWQRSHQCSYNSSSPEKPNVVDDSSPYSRVGNGLIHIVSGGGGHDGGSDLYGNSDDDDFWAYRNHSNNGVHELIASNSGNTLTGRFRNTDNNTSDTFVINA